MCHTPVFIKEVLNKPKHFTSRKIRLTLASLSVSPSIHLSVPHRVSFHPHSRLLKLNNILGLNRAFIWEPLLLLFLVLAHSALLSFIHFPPHLTLFLCKRLSRAVHAETNFGSTWQYLDLHLFIKFDSFIYLFIFRLFIRNLSTFYQGPGQIWNVSVSLYFFIFSLYFTFYAHESVIVALVA